MWRPSAPPEPDASTGGLHGEFPRPSSRRPGVMGGYDEDDPRDAWCRYIVHVNQTAGHGSSTSTLPLDDSSSSAFHGKDVCDYNSEGHSRSKLRCKSLTLCLSRDEFLALSSTLLHINHEEKDRAECSPTGNAQTIINAG